MTALPDEASAESLARALVTEGLAACVTRLPGATSVYRWNGAIESASSFVCLIKTTDDRLDALYARLRTLHPYEVPEGITFPAAGGLPAYLEWITGIDPLAPVCKRS